MIAQLYEVCKAKILSAFPRNAPFALSLDEWSEPSKGISCRTIVITWVDDDWQLQTGTADTHITTDPNGFGADSLRDHVQETLLALGRDAEDCAAVLGDNVSTNKAAAAELNQAPLKLRFLYCFCHTLHLVMSGTAANELLCGVFQLQPALAPCNESLSRLRAVVSWFRSSVKGNLVLMEEQKKAGVTTPLRMQTSAKTRWGSVRAMVARALELWVFLTAAINRLLHGTELRSRSAPPPLSPADQHVLRGVSLVVDPIVDALNLLQGSKYPTLPCVSVLLFWLLDWLQQPPPAGACAETAATVSQVKRLTLERLQHRFSHYLENNIAALYDPRLDSPDAPGFCVVPLPDVHEWADLSDFDLVCCVAPSLHPMLRTFWYVPNPERAKALKQRAQRLLAALCAAEGEEEAQPEAASPGVDTTIDITEAPGEKRRKRRHAAVAPAPAAPPSMTDRARAEIAVIQKETIAVQKEQARMELQLRAYWLSPRLPPAVDPTTGRVTAEAFTAVLPWWKEHVSEFPLLARVAKHIFCIPASTAKVEGNFSGFPLVLTGPPRVDESGKIQAVDISQRQCSVLVFFPGGPRGPLPFGVRGV